MAQLLYPRIDVVVVPKRRHGTDGSVLRQMGRELLLAQSSDWAFLMKTGTAREYAAKRTKDHVLRFTRLYEQLGEENVDNACLENCEWRDNIFADLNWQYHI